MKSLQKFGIVFLAFLFLIPSVSFAAQLNNAQVSAVIGLLQAFNVDQATILSVQNDLMGTTTPEYIVATTTPSRYSYTPIIQSQGQVIAQQAQEITTLTDPNQEVLAGSVAQAPVKTFNVLEIQIDSPSSIYLTTNIPVATSSIQFIGQDSNGNKIFLPITASWKDLHPDSGSYCDGQTGDCNYPIYQITLSEPLSDFSDDFTSSGVFQISLTGSDGTVLLSDQNLNGTYYPWISQN